MMKVLIIYFFTIIHSFNALYSTGVITKVACEGKTLTLECADRKINIIQAMYGRKSGSVCPHNAVYNTACNSSVSFIKVFSICQGKFRCVIKSSNNIFSDPCWYTNKYLEVRYSCDGNQNDITLEKAVNEVTICEHERATIECPLNSRIQFIEGNFGRTSSHICPSSDNIQNLHCHANITPIIQKCRNRTKCTISASNSVFGDPCRLTDKYLSFKYSCQENENCRCGFKTMSKAIACEWETISLQCEQNQSLVIGQANYGRLAPNVCGSQSQALFRLCVAPYTKDVISSRCLGKNVCSIPASNKLFGDSCIGMKKYLEFEYTCINNSEIDIKIERAEELKYLTLSCPTAIQVHYANYGRTSKDSELNLENYINDINCHAPSSFSIVQFFCSGKRQCTLHASSGIFGNPCPGIQKYLEVGYSCANYLIDGGFQGNETNMPN